MDNWRSIQVYFVIFRYRWYILTAWQILSYAITYDHIHIFYWIKSFVLINKHKYFMFKCISHYII